MNQEKASNTFHACLQPQATATCCHLYYLIQIINSNLILYYTEKGNTDTFETKDYEHKGGAQWLMGSGAHLHSTSSLAAIGSTTRPDGSTPQVGEPKYRFIPSGHLTINI